MGRYYSGDIEGKFWFGVQSSDAADRFGVEGSTPNYLEYYFDEENLEEIEDELDLIESKPWFKALHAYHEDTTGTVIKPNITNEAESDYADYTLGIQIYDSIKKTGQCSFSAEL
jgi:hypothetical protein